jgi:hypothetical protein
VCYVRESFTEILALLHENQSPMHPYITILYWLRSFNGRAFDSKKEKNLSKIIQYLILDYLSYLTS